MRGEAATQATMLTAVTPGRAGAAEPPDPTYQADGGQRPCHALSDVQSDVRLSGSALDTSRTSSEGLPSDGVVLRAQ